MRPDDEFEGEVASAIPDANVDHILLIMCGMCVVFGFVLIAHVLISEVGQ